MTRKIKVARVSSVKFFMYTQLRAQLSAMSKSGIEVTAIANDDGLAEEYGPIDGVRFVSAEIPRAISVLGDLRAVLLLYRLFRKERFDIVHSNTPKGGLLCAIAARLAGVPIRLHTFTGQTWATESGLKRLLLKFCDRVIGVCNTQCYADSVSQLEFLVSERVIKRRSIQVIGEGSIAGVDLVRFDKTKYAQQQLVQVRTELGIPLQRFVIVFVGRITTDKGIRELLESFKIITNDGLDVHLLIVGPLEEDGKLLLDKLDSETASRVARVGFTNEPEKYLAISDLLCIPSYREGFGTVVIEAAAMGVPAVGSDIYGLSDAIVDGETGLLVPPYDATALANALHKVFIDSAFKQCIQDGARKRVLKSFNGELINKLVIDDYKSLFDKLSSG